MPSFTAYRIHQQDGRSQGRLESLTLDDLSPGEVVLRVAWSGINYKDALAATGAGRIIRDFPRVGGIDASGTVLESADDRFHPGDEVLVTGFGFGVDHDGGFSEIARVPADWLVPLPAGLDLREAMILGTAGFTAGLALRRLLDNHQSPAMGPILVTGASGGVGSIAINLLADQGFEVVALTGKAAQADWLRSLGASEVLLRQDLEMGERPLEQGRWGGALDGVGGATLGWLTRTVRPWGNIVSYGMAAGIELQTTVMPFILRGAALLGVTSADCPAAWRDEVWRRLADDWRPSRLEDIVSHELTLEQLPGAFEDYLQSRITGRTLVRL